MSPAGKRRCGGAEPGPVIATAGPLQETLECVERIGERFQLPICGDDPSMAPVAELAEGRSGAGEFLAALPEADVSMRATASRFVRSYTARLASPTLAAWTLHRRVPDVGPQNVRFSLGSDSRGIRLGLERAEFACLPGDPAAQAAQAVLPAGELLEWLQRGLFRTHLDPLIRRLSQHRLVSEKVLWGDVAAMCAAAFVYWIVPAHGTAAGPADARAILEPAGAPWNGRGEWTEFELSAGLTCVFVRGSCCLRYRFQDQSRCVDCSIIEERDRASRLEQLLGV